MTEARYDIIMHTWGCKVNTYDTGLLQARFKRAGQVVVPLGTPGFVPAGTPGFVPAGKPGVVPVGKPGIVPIGTPSARPRPRVHVLNTCAVTAEATREAAREVRRIKSKEPFSKIVITGCGAQVDGGVFDQLPGADLIVANSHKGQIEDLVDQLFKGTLESKVFRSNIFRKEELEEGGGLEADHTRAFLKIQDGCNSFCSYCVIPFARGKSRSIPVDRLVARVNELEALGAREIVITGVHIADYEDVTGGRTRHLEDLIEAILARTTIPRIRVSSLEPVELSPRLIDLYEAHARLCRHFHLSIQSANTETLSRMRRRYTAEDVERIFSTIAVRLPDAFVGLDLIVGFPGETDQEFESTYELLARTSWTRLHVFPYSERPGTKALVLDGAVPATTRARRSALMRELSAGRYRDRAEAAVGSQKQGLVLSDPSRLITRDYWPVRLQKPSAWIRAGAEVNIKMLRFVPAPQGRMDGWFEGEAVP